MSPTRIDTRTDTGTHADSDDSDVPQDIFERTLSIGTRFTEYQYRMTSVISRFQPLLYKLTKANNMNKDDIQFVGSIFDAYIKENWNMAKMREENSDIIQVHEDIQDKLIKQTTEHAEIVSRLTLRIDSLSEQIEGFKAATDFFSEVISEYRSVPELAPDVIATESDVACVICKTNKTKSNLILSCGHKGIMCSTCTYKLFQSTSATLKCPLCRKKLLCALTPINSTLLTDGTQ